MNLRIKEILDSKGITVIDLANRLGVTRGACYNYINGNPTVDCLEKIANAINCDVRDFFPSKDDEKTSIEHIIVIDGVEYKISQSEIIELIKNKTK